MEDVLMIDYIKDMVLDNLTIKELNHMRACSKVLQKVVSDYSEQKMNTYLNIINRKITKLRQDNLSTIYDMPYTIIYNYYHTISRFSCLLTEPHIHTEFHKLMRWLHDKKVIHRGRKYIFDTDRYRKSDVSWYSYSLFDIMTCIYLCNTGRDWTSYSWSGEGLDQMKYLQGKLLPLS